MYILIVIIPVAVATLGPLSDEAHSLIAEIGRRATLCTADPLETTFLYQRISVPIQRFNAVWLADTFTQFSSLYRNHFEYTFFAFANFKTK